jgi:porin
MTVQDALAACAGVALACAAASARAEDGAAWTHDIVYTADVMGPLHGGASKAGRYLDNLDVIVEGDLGKAIGWTGATVHAYLLNNAGGRPNDLVGTLQGVDNIEVSEARARLYELWIEQSVAGGKASVRAGLYDLNSEFYATEASDLLIAPPFGIGSEFSSTGPNGPSIFPLTSLAVRVRAGGETGPYVQAAALSAQAGAFADVDHVKMGLNRGAILIAEAGTNGPTRFAAGAWTYTQKQDDLRQPAAGGPPARSAAYGGYVLAEQALWGDEGGAAGRAFLRAGASDGKTTPFAGGWQAGVRIDRVVAGRPDSAVSAGVHQGYLSGSFRANGRDAGLDLGHAESALELTYSDKVGVLGVQPDLQFIRHPGGERDRPTAIVGGVRFTIDFD